MSISRSAVLVAGALVLGFVAPKMSLADEAKKPGEVENSHAGHARHDLDKKVYQGYFDDDQVKQRTLSDYAGDWQSVYPYLQNGTLDSVMDAKAKLKGDMDAAGYKAYYEVGYKTDVQGIKIDGDKVTFTRGDKVYAGSYESDGFEILTYKKGNRGVRFIFKKVSGDEAAPEFIQFSDHRIEPSKADHFHIYAGNDRAALFDEVTNWPTYYPSSLSADEIVEEMLAH